MNGIERGIECGIESVIESILESVIESVIEPGIEPGIERLFPGTPATTPFQKAEICLFIIPVFRRYQPKLDVDSADIA